MIPASPCCALAATGRAAEKRDECAAVSLHRLANVSGLIPRAAEGRVSKDGSERVRPWFETARAEPAPPHHEGKS